MNKQPKTMELNTERLYIRDILVGNWELLKYSDIISVYQPHHNSIGS